MVENSSKDTVIARLMRISNKEDIQIITIDMREPYKNAVHQVIQYAVVVIDKLYILLMEKESLENCRKTIKEDMTQAAAKLLKGERLLLLKCYKYLD